jgi:opacity protein-like surface antigen
MKKSWLVGAMVLTVSQGAMAGFYAGAGIGTTYMKTKLSNTADVTVASQQTSQSYDDYNSNTNVDGTLLFGYGHVFPNRTYLALETFANYTSLKTDAALNTTYTNANSTLKMNSVYGLRVLPGYQFTPKVIGYAILGYAVGNAKIDSTTVTTLDGNQLTNTQTSDSKYLDGYQIGLGATSPITDRLALRGDVIYTGYQNSDVVTTSSSGRLTDTTTIKPYTLEANVSLVYHFGGLKS